MKKTFLCLLLLASSALTGAIPAAAQDTRKPVEFRRTLFVPVGQETIKLEAPKGMCFVDQSGYIEEVIFDTLAEAVRTAKEEVLLATFSPCDDLASFGTSSAKHGMITSGSVTWLNPSYGAKSPMERHDYLDMREATFRSDMLKKIDRFAEAFGDKKKTSQRGAVTVTTQAITTGYDFEDRPERTDNAVSIGYVNTREVNYESMTESGVIATTSIKRHPIEVSLRYDTTTEGHSLIDIHKLVNHFIDQQIAINE